MKAYKILGFVLRVCKPFTNISAIKSVYFAYVRSILEYASPIWSPQYRIYKNRLERTQTKFIKHLNFRCRKFCKNYEDGCAEHEMLSLEQRRILLDMGLLYDIISSKIDCPHLVSKIGFRTPNYRTRNTSMLEVPQHHSNYLKKSHCY